jgi:DNA (cytosine-5)-methyltransferase 1
MKLIELPRPAGLPADVWSAWNRQQQQLLLDVLKAPRAQRNGGLRAMSWFCGAGGDSQALHGIPFIDLFLVANHWERAIESHAANFPWVEHYRGDIREAPVERWPVADIFWASPECPQWSNARGKRRDFDATMQGVLFEDGATPEEVERSRALMEEVPLYLRGVQDRGGLVLAGVVENVIDVRAWDQWDRWLREFHAMGYLTRVIAINSMHADPRTQARAPQSRDRLYVAYWHRSLGRTPDWDKWLRPPAWCTTCDEQVQAVQVFKVPGRDMGRYRQQYTYRCPRTTCRNAVVEPFVLPAAVAIDWDLPGQCIGDRTRPLATKTLARIEAGLKRYAQPLMVPAGGTWRDAATPLVEPMPTRTTRENDALAVPPLLVPVEGRDGKEPAPATTPLRTQTARNETGLAWLPFVAELRGGGSVARPVSQALATVTASGNHHGLVTPEGVDWQHLLVPYYGNGTARRVSEPVGTLSTRDRYALVQGQPAIEDVRFRMLEPHEIGRAMSFADDYVVLGSKRERVRQYGNAVTPNAAEVIVCALVEAITGEDIERHAEPAGAVL